MTRGERMRAALEAAGKTQAQVAREIGVTTSHLWQVLWDKTGPSVPLLEHFAAAVGVEPGDLI